MTNNGRILEIKATTALGTNYNGTVNDFIDSPEYQALDWRSRVMIKSVQLIGAGAKTLTVTTEADK
jgi:hypothetical protein